MASSEVVSSIFLSGDKLFWVEELSVSTCPDLVNYSWFEIEEYTSWYMLSCTSLTEECVESIITSTNSLIRWHLSVWLDSVLEAEELPASVTDLDTGLSDMN